MSDKQKQVVELERAQQAEWRKKHETTAARIAAEHIRESKDLNDEINTLEARLKDMQIKSQKEVQHKSELLDAAVASVVRLSSTMKEDTIELLIRWTSCDADFTNI